VPAILEALLARAADPDGAPPGVVYCLAYRENDATGRFAPPWRLMPRGDVFRRLLEGWNPWLSCVIVRRPALTAAGAFDESLPAFEDYDLFLRLAANGARFVGVSRPLLIRHEHHGRGAASGDPLRLRRGLEGLDRKWREAILGRTGRATYRRWRARLYAGVEFVAVRNAVGRGQRWSAWRRVAAMGRYLPWSIHFPALAAVLVLLGPTGYDRLARLRDAVLRYGRDERARRA
jgi:GT2 family glycosyltransferase